MKQAKINKKKKAPRFMKNNSSKSTILKISREYNLEA